MAGRAGGESLFHDDLAVGVDLLAGGYGEADDFIKAGVIGIEHQLLGKEADGGIVYAGNLLDGGFHLSGTVGAVQIDHVETLLHWVVLLQNHSIIWSIP